MALERTPFRRFSFKNCSFALADDERLPRSDSHGAASKGRHPGGTFEFAEGFTFDSAMPFLYRVPGKVLNALKS